MKLMDHLRRIWPAHRIEQLYDLEGLTNRLHTLVNFSAHHHSSAKRSAEERLQLNAAIENFKEDIMEAFTKATADANAKIDALVTQSLADKAKIVDLEHAAANATAGLIPEQAAVDAITAIGAKADAILPPAAPVAG